MLMRRLILSALLVAAAYQARAEDRPGLGAAEFISAIKAIRPADGEDRFDQIPWLTSLWEARSVAAKEGKPILLWEMDGHPLGCG